MVTVNTQTFISKGKLIFVDLIIVEANTIIQALMATNSDIYVHRFLYINNYKGSKDIIDCIQSNHISKHVNLVPKEVAAIKEALQHEGISVRSVRYYTGSTQRTEKSFVKFMQKKLKEII